MHTGKLNLLMWIGRRANRLTETVPTAPATYGIIGTMALLSVTEAAGRSGLSDAHLRKLLMAGKLKGQKIGTVWVIDARGLDRFLASERKPGPKPKKQARNLRRMVDKHNRRRA